MKSLQKFALPLLAALAGFAFARPAHALTQVFELLPADAAKIDARDADLPADALKLVLNRSSDGESPNENDQSRLLFTIPPELFDAPAPRLSRAVLTLSSTFTRNYDGRPLFLHPLAAPFTPADATWNSRAAETPWTTPGGDFLTNAVSAAYSADLSAVSFDITPLLANTNAAAALRDNGAIVCFDTETPMDVKFMQLTFAATASGDNAPSLRYALLDPFDDARDFAVSYIDSRDATTVYWEQGEATVGKVILNGFDGSECRAILTMPESLAALPPARVQSVVAKFDAEIRDWKGEDIFLAPLATATKLERHPNNETSPVHGPSWNCADASVDPNATSYVLDGQTFDNAPWQLPGGDWLPEFAVRGTVTPPAKGTTGTAEFDLTALWHDDDARTALLANGAIAFLDPAAFPAVQADGRMARVNLYRPDEIVEFYKHAVSWMRVTQFEALAAAPATTYIDSSNPNRNFFAANKTLVTLNNAASGNEARALVVFPPELSAVDLHRAGSVNLLLSYFRSWPGDGTVNPVALHPAATAFRLDEATWNNAATGTPWTASGGDFLDAHVTAADTPSQSMLTFDLAPLLADAEAAAALAANGAVIRMLGDAPASAANNGYNVNGSASATPPVIVLAPADLAIRAIAAETATGALHFSVAGLDPLRSYLLESAPSLSAPDAGWTVEQPIPRTGELTIFPPADSPVGFYRIRAAD